MSELSDLEELATIFPRKKHPWRTPWGKPKPNRSVHVYSPVCRRGHNMDGDNVWVSPKTGQRQCKTCQRIYRQAHLQRKKESPYE